MAFVATDLALVSTCAINGARKNKWIYSTNDLPVTVYAAGYFAEVGSTSGNGQLTAYDEIDVLFDLDGTPFNKTMVVSNAAAGTVIFKTVKSITFGPYTATTYFNADRDIVTGLTLGEYAVIVDFKAVTTVAVTTTPVNVAFNLEIGGTNMSGGTGGIITINAAKALGEITSCSAIASGNVVSPSTAIDLEVDKTTDFTEGALSFIIQYA